MNIIDAITSQTNLTTTDNGAITNSSSLSKCVDFFAIGGSIRSQDSNTIINIFKDAFNEDKTIAVRLMFMFRDIRFGQGQRRPFRDQLNWLAYNYPNETHKLLSLISEYGRWDDIYYVFDTECEITALTIIQDQLQQDFQNIKQNKPISLLGKWLKRINTSNDRSVEIGHKIRKFLKLTCKDYRQTCKKLNEYLSVPENLMAARKWDEIDYSKVPSQCFLRNRLVFNKHDCERYNEFIQLAQEGKVKINAATLYPYQIIEKILSDSILVSEAELLWNNLTNVDIEENAIVVADVSGSMMGLPIQVCLSLAIYFSERAKGIYQNKFITFSEKPQMQELVGENIVEKVHNLNDADWGMNTDLRKVFELVLKAAIKNNIDPEDMVETVYIISDMEFDVGIETEETLFSELKIMFEEAGYVLPKLVYWNVNGRPGNIPVIKNEENTMMISGFSQNILSYIAKGITTPEQMMMEVVNAPRYNQINF